MELYSATWEGLAFDFPETLEEATHKKPATGNGFKQICVQCELLRRVKHVEHCKGAGEPLPNGTTTADNESQPCATAEGAAMPTFRARRSYSRE